ncbi:MAG TPA: GNAT family N-acetyltransferase [Anaerolineae bacterium]|nr:GNAT family N-acetyltransferase [Anaerolineae bacterium]
MNVRLATIADIEQCQRLDGSYVTDCVWRMDEASTPDSIGVSFRCVRLPRRVPVPYPRSTEVLYEDWQRGECFLVAEELGLVLGYLDMTTRYRQWQGWIEHLIVRRSHRNRGFASQLLHAAEEWARGSDLRAIVAPVQTNNDPAIRLLCGRGYSFSGFIDGYYSNGDIGILYSLHL